MALQGQRPVFLLKTPSEPYDKYKELISQAGDGIYRPVFVPVLEHALLDEGIDSIVSLLTSGSFHPSSQNRRYDGMIFTSQRAVAAFAVVLERAKAKCGLDTIETFLDSSTFCYVVGQATNTALSGLELPCAIKGQDAGNGAALAQFILQEYEAGRGKHDLLFMVGETRRDVIPTTLQADSLPPERRIRVNEIEVYRSVENSAFAPAFREQLRKNTSSAIYVAVFSPMGCESMLRELGLLEQHNAKYNGRKEPNVRVMTIGPTTRDYLIERFDFVPQAVATKPTPEALVQALLMIE